jgi:ABC-type sugar transport system ATPase subunit
MAREVEDESKKINKKDVFVLLGLTGCGKSTTI